MVDERLKAARGFGVYHWMKRWVGAALIVLSIGALTSVFMVARRSQLPTVLLEPGFELRLTKIALGRKTIEPWENLPRKLASYLIPSKFAAKTYSPSARSLEIHFGKFDSARGQFVAAKFDDPMVLFPDGRFSRGMLLNARSNVVRVEFSSYPRSDQRIKIQIKEGERKVAFSVPNPHRAEKQNWRPDPFPQTNSTATLNIVLQQSGDLHDPFILTSRSASGAPQSWTQWNVELHDAYGNWTRLRSNGRRVSNPEGPLMGDCLKLVARGREYISAGMVRLPEINSVLKLAATPRALELGLQDAFLLGSGTYHINEADARSMQIGQTAKTNSLVLMNDTLEVRTTLPSILLVRKSDLPFLDSMSARLRERTQDERKNNYFQSRKEISVTNKTGGVVATLLPLPVSTTEPQLEAEIIVAHRAAEFFVAAKPSGPGK